LYFSTSTQKEFPIPWKQNLTQYRSACALNIQGLPKVHPKTLKDLSPKTFPLKVWNLDNKTNLEVRVL
jgi:hypothetical protein